MAALKAKSIKLKVKSFVLKFFSLSPGFKTLTIVISNKDETLLSLKLNVPKN